MKLAVIGSRELTKFNIDYYLSGFSNIEEVISGGARGVDSLAEEWARNNNIPVRVFRPNYSAYGKKAPLVRNHLIIQASDEVLAIWDGKSRGTMYTVDIARKTGKPVTLYRVMKGSLVIQESLL